MCVLGPPNRIHTKDNLKRGDLHSTCADGGAAPRAARSRISTTQRRLLFHQRQPMRPLRIDGSIRERRPFETPRETS